MNEARIKLAEAMGWRNVGEQYGKAPGEDTYSLYPDPYADANDDYAVLEWARENLDDKDYATAMFAVVEEQGGDIGSSFPVYVKGNYARAACKVLEIDLEAT